MSREFHALHHADSPLLLPNAWDFASAAALVEAGFEAIGTTSLGVAAAHGLPDAAGCTREATIELARRLADLPRPVTVDVEAGFGGGPGEVAELAAELAELGIAGINLEDELGDPARHAELIGAVKERTPELFLNARTDTYWLSTAPSLADTISRAERYVSAGADGIFVPGMADQSDIRALRDALTVPLNILFQPGHRVEHLAALGVQRISMGSLLYRAALHAAVTTACGIRAGADLPTGIPSYSAVQDYVGGGRRRGDGGFQCPPSGPVQRSTPAPR
ncbi:isocitrate lyase/PEP mutase family protein [Saccharopolyspora phatthalungensis]|uniref:2-methylisocitrate lyase-like PEP mutase family enzyme n=1 Tax=Saccharopolyspora phatthalungensis TaxID=664693 RepID=A0A840Q4X4_9PSEU|nr:isocitrate lyase/phosphoenolpyruvate mutase family protein [Saccharopolyspora phatthalungensis]MBB5153739.1 2-methylisocitrate lyase-like PEP mutase family enzyme [Saccharopolyspora phatthalungensis]